MGADCFSSTVLTPTRRHISRCCTATIRRLLRRPTCLRRIMIWIDFGKPWDYGTPSVLRRQGYWAMLSGGKGQLYGNVYTCYFMLRMEVPYRHGRSDAVNDLARIFFFPAVAGSRSGPRPYGSYCRAWNSWESPNSRQQKRFLHCLQNAGRLFCSRLYAHRTGDHRQHGEFESAGKRQVV